MLTLHQKFSVAALYKQPVDSLRGFLSKRRSFWLALFSCVSFLVGNMVGQHGWNAFWKSVWGKEAIVFDGAVPPLALVPDITRFHGDRARYSFADVPQMALIPLPSYRTSDDCDHHGDNDPRLYSIPYLGEYNGNRCGSHPGIDITVPNDTPVYAVMNGIVTRTEERARGFGNTIVIEHPNVPDLKHPEKKTTLFSVYAHLGRIGVSEGDIVQKGQEIGASGQTGFATTPHLHFQIDAATAPFHPYWPFTTAEANEHGWNFVEAVDHGLGLDAAKQYTVDPLAYVQTHFDPVTRPVYAGVGTTAVPSATVMTAPAPPPLTWRERAIARRTSQRTKRTTRKPVQVVLEASSIPPSTPILVPTPNPSPSHKTISELSVLHDGSFEERMPEQLVIFARESNGNFARDVHFDGKLYLETAFGTADFSPATLTARDFDASGKAMVTVVVRGTKTMVPRVTGALEATGKPMVFSGQRSATRVSTR
ncbi:MAG: M23 family metallopeptidase [Patescibacteria group bacterium]